jgi:hypothetical protein
LVSDDPATGHGAPDLAGSGEVRCCSAVDLLREWWVSVSQEHNPAFAGANPPLDAAEQEVPDRITETP